MLNRRKFLSIAAVSALLTPTQLTLADAADAPTGETLQLTPEIIALEEQLRASGSQFSWVLHNELRHHYGSVSERMSRIHADIILKHAPMDEYVLNTICDWKIQSDPGMAVALLLTNAERYADLAHLCAACFLKSGDLYRARGAHSEAHQLYSQVLRIGQFSLTPQESLQPYRILANVRMTF